jgi:hypothetical protein
MEVVMTLAKGRALVVVALLTAGESRAASALGDVRLSIREEASKGADEGTTIAPKLRLRAQTNYRTSFVLTTGDLKLREPLDRPSMLQLMIDPHYYRLEFDALGGVSLSPTLAHGTLAGSLLLRF